MKIIAKYKMAQVMPNMITDVDDWLSRVEFIIEYSKKNGGDVPYKSGLASRTIGMTSMSICCSPCIIWSIVLRILLCPCYCPSGRALSNNGCTNISDSCIDEVYTSVVKKAQAPQMPDVKDFHGNDLIKLKKFTEAAIMIFNVRSCKGSHYELAEALFGSTIKSHCHPASVLELLYTFPH
jgi:hypothetical protein